MGLYKCVDVGDSESSTEASMIAGVMWEEWTYLTFLLSVDKNVRTGLLRKHSGIWRVYK